MQRTGHPHSEALSATDRSLLSRARDGDARSFEGIIATRLPRVYRLADGILGDGDVAAEAALDALVAAWHELPRLADLDRFDDWLDRVVLSECHMRLAQAGGGRAATPIPADLPERIAVAVAAEHRANHGDAAHPGRDTGWRHVVRWAVAVAVPLVVVALLASAGPPMRPDVPDDGRGGPAASLAVASIVPGAAGSATAPPGDGAPGGSTPPPTGGALPPALAPGGLAIVTLEGDDLNVRSAPSLEARRLRPVLPAGTRMLIVGGPVAADDMEWYEVQTDGELVDHFGWVSAGQDGEAWIAPARPRCWGQPDAATVAGLGRIDFLACYGRNEVRVRARAEGLWDAVNPEGACGWIPAPADCAVDMSWLLLPAAPVTLISDTGVEHDVVLAMPPDLSEALKQLPRQSTLLLTVSMDGPESAACRAWDPATGRALIPDERAVTACRLQFIVQEVAFRDPSVIPEASP